MHLRVFFYAQLRHAHCKTYYLKEESRRIWWEFLFLHNLKEQPDQISPHNVSFSNNIVCMPNIVCHNKSCSPHLVGVVAIKFHIGSASRVHMWNLILSRTREYVHIYLNHNFTIQLDKQVVILDLTSVRFLLKREWITWKCSIKKTLKYRIQKLGVDIVYFVFSKTAGKWKYAFKSLMLNLCEWMEYLDIERWYLFDCNCLIAIQG